MVDTIVNDSIGDVDEVSFCITPTSMIDDVEVKLFVSPPPRPGFETNLRVLLSNVGSSKLNGILTLLYDSTKVEFITINNLSTVVMPGEIELQVSELSPLSEIVLNVKMRVLPPPINTILDSIKLYTSFVHDGIDYTPNNNNIRVCRRLIGSYDPNDIAVREGPFILESQKSDFLHYLIRFQNTGTADAINVLVENSIDKNLDLSTFTLEETSHLSRVSLMDDRTVIFNFENIYLPDSTANELESHGFIAYKIKPDQNIGVGEEIANQASIFFDFNDAIITNKVVTQIIEPNSVLNLSEQNIQFYPNLTSDLIYVQSDIIFESYDILSLEGVLIQNKKYNSGIIDVSSIQEGAYLCVFKTQNGQKISNFFVKI